MPDTNDVFDDAEYVYEMEVLGGKYVCPTTGETFRKGQTFTTGIDLSGFRNKFRIIAKKLKKVVEEVVEEVISKTVEAVVEDGGKKLDELLNQENDPTPTPTEPEKKPEPAKAKTKK